ncbi:MAG: hypothetical protein ABIK28_03250 [Planctomycetota bacterium]
MPVIPNLIQRELVVALVLFAFIPVFSIFFDAPLGDKANPDLSPNPTKAPWLFKGFQERLMHFHPFFALFIMSLLLKSLDHEPGLHGSAYSLGLLLTEMNQDEEASAYLKRERGDEAAGMAEKRVEHHPELPVGHDVVEIIKKMRN